MPDDDSDICGATCADGTPCQRTPDEGKCWAHEGRFQEGDGDRVERLASNGVPQDVIADCIGVSKDVLIANFRDELDRGTAQAHAEAAQILFQEATGGGLDGDDAPDRMLLKFYCKTQLGYHPTEKREVSGPDGEPIETEQSVTFEWPNADRKRDDE